MLVEEMPAGREMDALIAEKVMGWAIHSRNTAWWVKVADENEVTTEVMAFTYGKDRFAPSTNIAAAWEVVEKITDQKHWAFKLRRLPGKDYMACFIRLTKTGRDDFESKPSKAAPFAICRAALKAMGVVEI